MQGREPPQTTCAAGEIEVLKTVDDEKASEPRENGLAHKNCLVAKEPSDGAIAKFGQEAGAFQKEGRRIKAPGEASTHEVLFLEGGLDPVKSGGREDRIRVQEEEDFSFGVFRAKIHLSSALAEA